MQKIWKPVLGLCCSVSVASLACGTAYAQDGQEPQEAQSDDEEFDDSNVIIVNATLRANDVQDIPIAVTAVTPVELERQGIANIQTLGAVAASFNIQSSQTESQGTSIRIRGVGTTGNNIGLESAVGVFIDGVYQSRPGVALGELVDIEQLEVLRGPQGTLFGRNTTAGALVVRNKRPDLNEYAAEFVATYGNFDLFNAQAVLNAPLVQDTLGLRFSGSYRRRDGFITSAADGSESNNRDRFLLRGQLLWEPSPDISIRLIGDYQQTNENCCASVTLSGAVGAPAAVTDTLFPGGPQFQGTGPRPNEFPFPIRRESNSQEFVNDIEQWGISGELNWDLGGAELTAIVSYRDFLGESRQDEFNAGLVYSVSGVTFPDGTPPTFDDITTFTAEARLQGDAFDGKLDWLIGAFYSDEQIVEEFALGLGPDFGNLIGQSFGLPGFALQGVADAGSIFSNGIFDPTDPGFAQGTFAQSPLSQQSALNRFDQSGESFSVFTHNIFSVTDTISLTVGARYVDDSKDASFDQLSSTGNACAASRQFFTGLVSALGAAGAGDPSGLAAINGALTPIFGAAGAGALQIPAIAGAGNALNCFVFSAPADASGGTSPLTAGLPIEFADNFSDDEFIYTLQAAWEPNDDILLYASFTHGYKAGGFNLDASAAIGGADPRFNSEEIDAYELGLKTTLLDGRVRANIALYYSDLSDFQVLEFTGTQFQTFNVDDVTSQGFEIEFFGQWSDYISTNLAVTYTDAEYGDNCDGSFVAAGGANPAAGLCGFSLTNAPEWTGIAGATYDGPINSSEWTMLANVNLRYETDRRTSTNPNDGVGLVPFDVQDANFKVNARLGFTTPDEKFTIELWGRNLTNEVTRAITFNTPLVGSSAAGTASRSAFLEEPRTYGATLRAKF